MLSSADKQWKIKSPSTGRLARWQRLVDLLDEEPTGKKSSPGKLRQKLANEVRVSEKLPYELRRRAQLESLLEQIQQHLSGCIRSLGRTEQALRHQQQFKSKALFNSSQMNKSNESPDPGGGHKQAISRSSLIELNDLRKSSGQSNGHSNGSSISTGNLARIKDNSLMGKMDFTNQTTDKIRSLNQFFSSFGFNSLTGHLDGAEKGKNFYTNAMIAIVSAGLAMLFVNLFVLFLGYKCIQRRRVLKSRRTERRPSKEASKESLTSASGQANQQLINSSANTMSYGRGLPNGNLISDSSETVVNEGGKCYCGGQFCNCANEVDKLQLINSDSSFFTSDTLITDQPLSHLVSPICKLINTGDSYESPPMMSQSKLNHRLNDQLLTLNGDTLSKQQQQYSSIANVLGNNMAHSLSSNQLKSDESNLQNCDCNLLTANAPMLAVLETHPGDSNLLTIGCEPTNLYNFFESNYYAPFDPTNNLDSSGLPTGVQASGSLQSYQTAALFSSGMAANMAANLGTNTGSSGEQSQQSALHAHTPQTSIQLQLLTEHLLNGTPSSQANN